MAQAKRKTFSQFMEDVPPSVTTPTNVASGTHIAGLPPDMPPVFGAAALRKNFCGAAALRKKSNIRRRKTARSINNKVV
jgi:hypothetical protein